VSNNVNRIKIICCAVLYFNYKANKCLAVSRHLEVLIIFLVHGQVTIKTVRSMLSDRCPVYPVYNVGVLWLNGWMH